jgi:DNA-binding NarL/FixJ family response regulator
VAKDHASGVSTARRTLGMMRLVTPRAAARPRILIVDDRACFRDVARALLEFRGYDVVGEAADSGQAKAAVARLAPDGVLLDVHLGADNGFVVAAELTRSAPGLAVLLTSADADHDYFSAAGASGACGFVHKRELVGADLSRFWPT